MNPSKPNTPGANRIPPSSGFVTTRWTRILLAKGETEEAHGLLGELVELYQPCILSYCRATSRSPELAEDLSQSFCRRLLEGGALNGAESTKGRFRSYLLGALKHFIRDEWRRGTAQKRGGDALHESFEEQAGLEAPGNRHDLDFDREWALTVVRVTMDALRGEYEAKGKSRIFQLLSPWLTPVGHQPTQSEIAGELGISETGLKVSIHRIRTRFRSLVRKELADTLRQIQMWMRNFPIWSMF